MFDIKAYEHLLIELGVKDKDVAGVMQISPATLGRKKRGESDFYRSEIQALKDAYSLSPVIIESIFFKAVVA